MPHTAELHHGLRKHDIGALRTLRGAIHAHVERTGYADMGMVAFARDVLGIRLWKGQREAAKLVDSGAHAVAIKTGHGVGKTLWGAVAICYWLGTGGPGTAVVTSAPTNRQVEELLWREVNSLWIRSAMLTQLARPLMREVRISADWVGYGFSTHDPGRFQGWHAPRLRFLIDEANAFPENIWQVIDTCLTGGDQQLVMLGNPIVSVGRFYRSFGDPAVAKLTISAREHPNVRSGRELIPGAVTAGWIERFEDRYKSDPNIIRSRIDGEFPESGSVYSIVPIDWLRRARTIEPKTISPVVYGLDVARYGDNLCVLTRLEGQRLVSQESWGHRSTTYTVAHAAERMRENPADAIVVDDPGVGGGVTDGLRDQAFNVVAFEGGGKAVDAERFHNRNAEAWWHVREAFEHGMMRVDGPEGELDMQLSSREYQVRGDKRIALEGKTDYTKRTGLPSPDFADSFAMAVWWLMGQWKEMAA